MPKCLKTYADKDKALAYRNATRLKNYHNGDYGFNRYGRYTPEERQLIKEHRVPDRELAQMLGMSVQAIQVQRVKMKED